MGYELLETDSQVTTYYSLLIFMPGKFIVIDGTDGSGKETQTKILINTLNEKGYPVAKIDFPQYGQKSACLVEEYLSGKYGTADEVGPYIASIFYAADRYDASFKIKEWLKQGKIVVADRYVSANMGHQGCKIADDSEREKYLDWLYDLEYNKFGIPKPNLNIILHVPAHIAQQLSLQRETNHRGQNLKRDIHEQDINHLKQAEKTYLYISEKYSDFTKIECTKDDQMMTREEISDIVWKKIEDMLENRHLYPSY